jgi:hypothetical protein
LTLLLAKGLDREKASIGYRVIAQGRVVERLSIPGDRLSWAIQEPAQRGTAQIDVPAAAILHAYARYDGVAYHHLWIGDPSAMQNPRRATYERFDPKLEILMDFLAKPEGPNSRDLESGVAWLLWLLGFSVAHLGGTKKTQEGPDLLVTTPAGHFAVVECTTGLLRTENKLPLLVSRTAAVRERLARSNNQHLRVLPVMATSKTKDEVAADLEQARSLGVLVLTKETLETAALRTLTLPNADELYAEAQKSLSQGIPWT